jgi:cold shock CspA family protein
MTSSDRYSIPRSEWPTILARREKGETYAAIAADFGVSGPTVRNILMRAQGEAETPDAPVATVESAPPEAVEAQPKSASRLSLASVSQREEASTSAASAAARAEAAAAAESESPAPAKKVSKGGHSPLAERLAEAAEDCAAALDRAARDGLDDEAKDAIKRSLHEVRRAAAAIDIALGQGDVSQEPAQKRKAEPMAALPPRPSPARAPRPAAEPRPEAKPTAQRTRTVPPAAEGRSEPARPRRAASPAADGATTMEGTVKFFRPDQGYGFVMPDEGGKDIYVPVEALQRSELDSLERNQRVRLVVTDSPKGPEADSVELISS